MVSVFGWPDPNTGFDQSEHALYTIVLFYNIYYYIIFWQIQLPITIFVEKPSGEKRIDNVTAMAALETMAENSRIECLNHAVVQKFMEQKWSIRARKWYWGCLSIYAIFLLSFTTYISLFTQGKSE
jgi:hypothetical protein